jgi:hypothetical protein
MVPVDKAFVLWRCIRCGPVNPANIDERRSGEPALSEEQFEMNRQFFARPIDV